MKAVIFIGPQASGKSSFYLLNFYKTHIRLSLDMLNTRHREKLLLDACLVAKQPCVIDNTNPTKEDRVKYITEFKKHKFVVDGYFFISNLDDWLKRNSLRTGKERISDIGIKSTFKKLACPEHSEGFDRLYGVTIKNNEFIVEEFSK